MLRQVIERLPELGVRLVSAALEPGPVTASRGVTLLADTTLDEVMEREFDLIVLPGGLPGADHLDRDPRIHELLRRQQQGGRYAAAICAAPKVLAGSGLLRGRRATRHRLSRAA
ncbi:MAG: DJ-1/PfpI family protein [Candidatus Sedimenticola endophacoides]